MKKILLADDSVTIQKVVSLILANTDFELVSVGNGDAAISKIDEIKPDLIMADTVMPGKNGYEVCEYIKNTPALKHIPVLLLAGTFEPLNEEEAKRVGIDDFIVKPFESQELINKATALLSKAEEEKETVKEIPIEAPVFIEETKEVQPGGEFEISDFLTVEEETAKDIMETSAEPALELGSEGFFDNALHGKGGEETVMFNKPPDISVKKDEGEFELGIEPGEEVLKAKEPVKTEELFELRAEEMEEIKHVEVIEPLEEAKEVAAGGVTTAVEALPKEKLEEMVSAVSKEVIEKIAWEVIPEIAEKLLREEIEKIKEAILKLR